MFMDGIATATPSKRGHFYRVIMGTFSWSSDKPEKEADKSDGTH
jgi:hypothetical protein